MAIRDIVQAAAGNGKEPTYVEDVFSTALYTGNGNVQAVNNDIALGSAYGGSVYFNGTNSYLSAPDNAVFDFGSGNFTIEFWVYLPQDPGLYYPYFAKRSGGTYEPVSLLSGATERNLRLLCSTTGSGWEVDLTSSVDLSLRTWTHVAVTRNGNVFTIWINGVDRGTQTTSGSLYVTTAPFYISYDPGTSRYLKAYISNFRVVKGTAVYTSTFTPSTSPLTNVSGTALLTCQAPNLTTDNSSNAFSLTAVSTSSFSGYGPFTDAALAEGGMVWIKSRAVNYNIIYDTVRGPSLDLYTDYAGGTYQETSNPEGLNAFNSGGFNVGNYAGVNASNENYASWTFGIAKKFFDVVTWTGNSVAGRQIPHNLGSVPGCIIVKCRTGSNEPWYVYHRSLGPTKHLTLNTTNAENTSEEPWYNTAPTATNFTVAQYNSANGSGKTYVAYLFAHDAGGFGEDGEQNVISCGSYTGTGGALSVTLGYEPQFILVKPSSTTGDWQLIDTMRGWSADGICQRLEPNTSDAQATSGSGLLFPTATGFGSSTSSSAVNASGVTYVYVAIRRGPMKIPELGTTVFNSNATAGDVTANSKTTFRYNAGFPVDLIIQGYRAGASLAQLMVDRLRGYTVTTSSSSVYLSSSSTNIEGTNSALQLDNMQGVTNAATAGTSNSLCGWMFRRAPSVFDIVCYTGNGATGRQISHNLGVAPELIISRIRNEAATWNVYSQTTGFSKRLVFNTDAGFQNLSIISATSATTYTVGTAESLALNTNGFNFVAYLFATCPGVSKVGSYTGTGTTLQVNCGFTTGARFVMIKRTDDTAVGDWYVWDSARGIVAGNDPYLLMNSAAAEVTSTDYVDTYSAGFEITSTAPGAINATGGTFLFLAIA